jgi:hypothetical protein
MVTSSHSNVIPMQNLPIYEALAQAFAAKGASGA